VGAVERALACYERYWGDPYCKQKCAFYPFCERYALLKFREAMCPWVRGFLKFAYAKSAALAAVRWARTLKEAIERERELRRTYA